ncbi:unnamed protein product, partial [Staurois parvus]
MPVSATYQCCQSVPPISAGQCRLSVCISARQCCLSVRPNSASQCRLTVPYMSAAFQCPSQCPSVPPISAAYQCPSLQPHNAHQ